MSVAIRAITRLQDADDAPALGAGQDGHALTWDNDAGAFAASAMGGGGVSDHGALTGLADDDHPQYRRKLTNWLLVDPAGKGDYTTIGAALAAVTSPGSTNRWLIDVMPGEYNESITVPTYTTVRSIVPLTAMLTASGGVYAGLTGNVVVVLGGEYAKIDGLTIYHATLSDSATAVHVGADYGRVQGCNIYRWQTSGASKTQIGISSANQFTEIWDTRVFVRADNDANLACGVWNHYAFGMELHNSIVGAISYSGSSSGFTVGVGGGTYSITLYGCTVSRIGNGDTFAAGSGAIYVERTAYSGAATGAFAHIDRTRQNDSDATILPVSSSQTPMILKAVAGQSAHLLNIQDSSANLLFGIEADGDMRTSRASANTNTPSGATAHALPIYNAAGTLLGYIPIYGSTW